MTEPKAKEHWLVQLHDREKTIIYVGSDSKVYPCGDEEGWPISAVTKWLRRIRLS